MSDLARYLFQKGHFSASKGRVKTQGFNPGRHPDLSMFDVRGADAETRRTIGNEVGRLRGAAALARAELAMSALDDLPLHFVRDDTPIERHGNIVGWPAGASDDARSARLQFAAMLASRASLHVDQ